MDAFDLITWIISAVGLVLAAGTLYVEGTDWLFEEEEEEMNRHAIETLLSKSTEELIEIWQAYERRQNDEDESCWLLPEEIEEMEVVEDIIANRFGGPTHMYDLAADRARRRH